MRPAFSVIFFTVVSGAGLGVLALATLLDLATMLNPAVKSLHAPALLWALVVGWMLTVAGLSSSTLHLANPKNAWRSAARFRTSWLSREAVFACLLLPIAALYAWLVWRASGAAARGVMAIAALLLAWTVLVCTAMIYASLKPIRQWHTRWTPAAYFAMGHWSGALVLLAVIAVSGAREPDVGAIAFALGVVALIVKLIWWRRASGMTESRTLEQAIGVSRGVRPPPVAGRAPPSIMAARLLDAGHTHGTFLTHEFGFTAGRVQASLVRLLAWFGGFVLPLIWLGFGGGNMAAALFAAGLCIIGLMAERWLFFAEARHTVRLFHGDART